MAVGEICNREVVIARPKESALEAAQLMRRHHVGDLVVVDDAKGRPLPIGILTDRDLVLEVMATAVDPGDLVIGDIMQRELLLIDAASDLVDAVKQMSEFGVRRAPVVNAAQELQGILTLDDILDLIAEELSALARLVGRAQRREADLRS